MEKFIIYFLCNWGLMVILYKYEVKSKIALFGKITKKKFFYLLSECEFCIEHHVGIVTVILFGLFNGWDYSLIIFPFMFASLSNIIKNLAR